MNDSVFRKKSLERISSPEKLNDYMKVSGVRMWLVLAVIIFLLLAVVIWGFTGRIEERTIDAEGQVRTESFAPVSLLVD